MEARSQRLNPPMGIPPKEVVILRIADLQIKLGRPEKPCARSYVYAMIKDGLPVHRLGKTWAGYEHEVNGWLLSRPGVNLPQAG